MLVFGGGDSSRRQPQVPNIDFADSLNSPNECVDVNDTFT